MSDKEVREKERFSVLQRTFGAMCSESLTVVRILLEGGGNYHFSDIDKRF